MKILGRHVFKRRRRSKKDKELIYGKPGIEGSGSTTAAIADAMESVAQRTAEGTTRKVLTKKINHHLDPVVKRIVDSIIPPVKKRTLQEYPLRRMVNFNMYSYQTLEEDQQDEWDRIREERMEKRKKIIKAIKIGVPVALATGAALAYAGYKTIPAVKEKIDSAHKFVTDPEVRNAYYKGVDKKIAEVKQGNPVQKKEAMDNYAKDNHLYYVKDHEDVMNDLSKQYKDTMWEKTEIGNHKPEKGDKADAQDQIRRNLSAANRIHNAKLERDRERSGNLQEKVPAYMKGTFHTMYLTPPEHTSPKQGFVNVLYKRPKHKHIPFQQLGEPMVIVQRFNSPADLYQYTPEQIREQKKRKLIRNLAIVGTTAAVLGGGYHLLKNKGENLNKAKDFFNRDHAVAIAKNEIKAKDDYHKSQGLDSIENLQKDYHKTNEMPKLVGLNTIEKKIGVPITQIPKAKETAIVPGASINTTNWEKIAPSQARRRDDVLRRVYNLPADEADRIRNLAILKQGNNQSLTPDDRYRIKHINKIANLNNRYRTTKEEGSNSFKSDAYYVPPKSIEFKPVEYKGRIPTVISDLQAKAKKEIETAAKQKEEDMGYQRHLNKTQSATPNLPMHPGPQFIKVGSNMEGTPDSVINRRVAKTYTPKLGHVKEELANKDRDIRERASLINNHINNAFWDHIAKGGGEESFKYVFPDGKLAHSVQEAKAVAASNLHRNLKQNVSGMLKPHTSFEVSPTRVHGTVVVKDSAKAAAARLNAAHEGWEKKDPKAVDNFLSSLHSTKPNEEFFSTIANTVGGNTSHEGDNSRVDIMDRLGGNTGKTSTMKAALNYIDAKNKPQYDKVKATISEREKAFKDHVGTMSQYMHPQEIKNLKRDTGKYLNDLNAKDTAELPPSGKHYKGASSIIDDQNLIQGVLSSSGSSGSYAGTMGGTYTSNPPEVKVSTRRQRSNVVSGKYAPTYGDETEKKGSKRRAKRKEAILDRIENIPIEKNAGSTYEQVRNHLIMNRVRYDIKKYGLEDPLTQLIHLGEQLCIS